MSASAATLRAEHVPGAASSNQRLILGFGQWLKTLGYNEKNTVTVPNAINLFLEHQQVKGTAQLKKLSAKDFAEYFEYLKQRPNMRREGRLAPTTINKQRDALVLFSQYVKATTGIHLPLFLKSLPIERKIPKVLTIDEVRSLYETVDPNTPLGLRDRALLSVMYGGGLRLSEVEALDVNDIKVKQSQIHVRKGKKHKERSTPITERSLNDIVEYIEHGREHLMKEKRTDALFLSNGGAMWGQRVSGQGIYVRMKQLQRMSQSESLKRKKFAPHTLRHSIATHLYAKGMSLQSVQKFLGHAALESTQIYVQLSKKLQEDERV